VIIRSEKYIDCIINLEPSWTVCTDTPSIFEYLTRKYDYRLDDESSIAWQDQITYVSLFTVVK
jgi:hypothetical protein